MKESAQKPPQLSESERRLLDQLTEQGNQDSIPPDPEATAPEGNDDFTPTDDTGNPIVQPETEDIEVDDEFDGDEFVSSLAETAVATMEIINTVVLPPYYESLVMGNVNKEVYYSLLDKLDKVETDEHGNVTKIPTLTPAEKRVRTKMTQVRDFERNAEMKQTEQKKLVKHFDRFFRSMGWDAKVPPWVELTMAVAAVQKRTLMPLWKAYNENRKEKAQLAQKAKTEQKEAA